MDNIFLVNYNIVIMTHKCDSEFDCVQRCFIVGRNNASCIEDIADCLLAYPRLMWGKFDRYGSTQCNCTTCFSGCMDMAKDRDLAATTSLCLCGSPLYVLSSIFAAPFLLLGMSIKLCVLCLDNDALAHNREIEVKICKYDDVETDQIDIAEKQDMLGS